MPGALKSAHNPEREGARQDVSWNCTGKETVTAVVLKHAVHFRDVFALPGMLANPVLMFGVQDVKLPRSLMKESGGRLGPWRRRVQQARRRIASLMLRGPWDLSVPEALKYPLLADGLRAAGIASVQTLDLFDPRADLQHDMNLPIDPAYHERYGTVIDIGSIEHVFDFRVCLENCLRLVRVGGHILFHVPVQGYFAHGFYTFNPEVFVAGLQANQFDIRFQRYTTMHGVTIRRPQPGRDVLLWIVGRKRESLHVFNVPQQSYWEPFYSTGASQSRQRTR